MEMPPKSDEDTEKSASSPESADSPKKRPRTRSRLTRAKSKSRSSGDSEDKASAPELPFEAPPPRAEAAAERRREPEPEREREPESRREREPEPRRERESNDRREARGEEPAPVERPSAPDQTQSQQPEGGDDRRGGSDGAQDQGSNQAQQGQQQQSYQGHGQHEDDRGGGGQQFQGGGKFNRWRDKKFRGGKWNKHGGGGQGGGGGPKHPPQPPPPKTEIYFGELPDPARFQDLEALEKSADEIANKRTEPIRIEELYALGHAELLAKAKELGATFDVVPNRKQLLTAVFNAAAEKKIPLIDCGWLDITDRGFGFVVHPTVNYRLYPENTFVPEVFIRKYGLKRGHRIEVQAQAPQGNDRCPAAVKLREVMGGKPEDITALKPFEELTPYYPLKRIWLEMQGAKDVSMRMVDIITPIGFGQRGLIVAPPRTGKTVLLQNMANSIAENSPEAKLIILLIDERPEEVTDFRRHCKGEVVSSTFDETPESHVHCAEMVIEKARRMVEQGEHVVILLDSITRLARAYNALASNSGKIMSGGLEATALQKPKRFFGSARNIEGAGSLTILGTALVDTGSRMDEIIFEEFKGTGNMELHLDRDLVNKRIFPALNIDKSGTRKEELIYHPDELARIYGLRRAMQGVPAADSIDMLIQRLKKTKTNAEFLMSLNR